MNYYVRNLGRRETNTVLKQRRFWATHVNRKWAFFSFNMPQRYHICIVRFLYSYRDDLPKNLTKWQLKSAKSPLPADLHRSKTLLLKFPNINKKLKIVTYMRLLVPKRRLRAGVGDSSYELRNKAWNCNFCLLCRHYRGHEWNRSQ